MNGLQLAKPKTTMDEMNLIFKMAKEKAINRIRKEGNTATPWNDFSVDHLKFRLINEYGEWRRTGHSDELLDIINLAAFVYLAQLEREREIAGRSWRSFQSSRR